MSQEEDNNQKVAEIVPGLTAEQLNMAIRMIESGLEEKDIPYILGIEKQHSIVSWENQDPKIRHLFNQAREVVLNKVENSLLRAALGGTLTTVKTGEKDGKPFERITVKEIGPNIVAAEKILRLFRPIPWADLSSNQDLEDKPRTPEELEKYEVDKIRKLGGEFLAKLATPIIEAAETN